MAAKASLTALGLVLALVAAWPARAAVPLPEIPGLIGLDPEVAERIASARQAVADEPGEAARWLALGRVYHAHHLPGPAAVCYGEATRLEAGNAKAWYALAHAESELGQPEQALARLARVIERAPDYAPAHWRRGRWLLDLGRLDEAERAFRGAIAADPGDPAGTLGLARVHLERGEPRPAIALLERLLATDPTQGAAIQLLGAAFRAAGDEEAARRTLALSTGTAAEAADPWLEEILAAASGVGNRLRLLSARLERGEIEPVIAELEALRREHPADVGVLNKLAEAYLHRRDPTAALGALQAAHAAAPGEFFTLIHLAQAERARGRLDAALEWADRAAAVNSTLWHVHFERAGILYRQGRLREALAALDAAMDRGAHPNPNAWLMRGDILLQLADWAGAAETLERATERFPFAAQAFVGLAVARAELGELDAARSALAMASRLQPEDETMTAVRARIQALARAAAGNGGASE